MGFLLCALSKRWHLTRKRCIETQWTSVQNQRQRDKQNQSQWNRKTHQMHLTSNHMNEHKFQKIVIKSFIIITIKRLLICTNSINLSYKTRWNDAGYRDPTNCGFFPGQINMFYAQMGLIDQIKCYDNWVLWKLNWIFLRHFWIVTTINCTKYSLDLNSMHHFAGEIEGNCHYFGVFSVHSSLD